MVVREADVAVRPIGHVLEEPVHVCHGQVVDMERPSWTAPANEDTEVFMYTRAHDRGIRLDEEEGEYRPALVASLKRVSLILTLWFSV